MKDNFKIMYDKLNEDDKELFFESIIENIYDSLEFNKKKCPVCGEEFNVFLPFNGLKQSLCPNCNTISRQRFVYYYLNKKFIEFSKKINFLVFSPESLHFKFKDSKKISYVPVDFNRYLENVEHFSIDRIPFNDNSFEVIYEFNNVVQIKNDINALKELYRVVKPVSEGGFVILYDYVSENPKTIEEIKGKKVTRVYGKDFFDKVESVGFDIEIINSNELFDEKELKKYSILPTERFFVCTKQDKSKSSSLKVSKSLYSSKNKSIL